MSSRSLWLIPILCLCAPLPAGDLGAATVAKIIRVMAVGTGSKAVACEEKDIAGELANLGVALDPGARLAWAGSDKEASRLGKEGRLVMCGNPDWLALGAGAAITAEGGRPAIYLNLKNAGASGLTVPDSIVKISKVVK